MLALQNRNCRFRKPGKITWYFIFRNCWETSSFTQLPYPSFLWHNARSPADTSGTNMSVTVRLTPFLTSKKDVLQVNWILYTRDLDTHIPRMSLYAGKKSHGIRKDTIKQAKTFFSIKCHFTHSNFFNLPSRTVFSKCRGGAINMRC